MSKKFKNIIVLSLVLSMVFSMTTFAAPIADATQEVSSVSGGSISSNVAQQIIRFVAPTALDFAMDPYETAGQGQIISPTYFIASKSSIPLAVSVRAVYDHVAGDVETLTVSGNDTSKKQIYMWLEPAKSMVGAVTGAVSLNDAVSVNGANVTFTTQGTPAPVTSDIISDNTAEPVYIVLEDADYAATVSNNGSTVSGSTISLSYNSIANRDVAAAFKLNGQMTANTGWKSGDVKVKFVYSTKVMTPTKYNDIITNNNIIANTTGAVSANVVSDEFGGGAPSIANNNYTARAAGSLTITGVSLGNATDISSITYTGSTGSLKTMVKGTDYTTTNNTIVLSATAIAAIASNSSRNYTITFNNSAQTAIVITVNRTF